MDCRKYVESRIDFNTFNTFNNVKVSEVIKKLQEIKKEHGDLDVTIDFKDITDFTVLDGGIPIQKI